MLFTFFWTPQETSALSQHVSSDTTRASPCLSWSVLLTFNLTFNINAMRYEKLIFYLSFLASASEFLLATLSLQLLLKLFLLLAPCPASCSCWLSWLVCPWLPSVTRSYKLVRMFILIWYWFLILFQILCFVSFYFRYFIQTTGARMAACCVMFLRWQSREHSHLVVNTLAFIQATLQASERILGFGVQSGSEASPSLLKMIAIIQWRTGTYK